MRQRVAIFLVLTAGLLLGCSQARNADGADDASVVASQRWATVEPRSGQLTWTQTIAGQVRVNGVVEVGAEISGEIVEVLAEEGDDIESGALLVRFETEFFEARLRQAEAQLDVAEARLSVAATQLDEARSVLERRLQIASNSLLSEEALEARLNLVAVREQQLRIAEAEVALAEAQVDTAQIDLQRTEIKAPATGQITRKNIEAGESVNAVQSAPVLFEITRRDAQISIYAEISEELVGAVSSGDEVRVRAAALGADSLPCEIARIYRRPVNRNGFIRFGLMIDCDSSDDDLWSGMSVNVDLGLSGREEQILIPVSAFFFAPETVQAPLQSTPPGHRILWVLDADGSITDRYVLTGFSDGIRAEVLDGNLQPSDRVFVPNG